MLLEKPKFTLALASEVFFKEQVIYMKSVELKQEIMYLTSSAKFWLRLNHKALSLVFCNFTACGIETKSKRKFGG